MLDLSPEQRSEVLRLRQAMLAREANLVEQRRRLNLQIKVLVLFIIACIPPAVLHQHPAQVLAQIESNLLLFAKLVKPRQQLIKSLTCLF